MESLQLSSFFNKDYGILGINDAWVATVSEKDYRASGGLAQSSLNLFLSSPQSYLESTKFKKEPTADMEFGTCFHALMLEEDPSHVFVEKPDFGDQRNKDNKAEAMRWEAENAGVIWLEAKVKEGQQSDLQRLKNMKKSVNAHPELQWLKDDFMKETVMYADVVTDSGNLLLKGRLDVMSKSKKIILDYKTTDDASLPAFSRTIVQAGYDIQAVQYLLLALANGFEINDYQIAAVEKKAKSDTSGSDMNEIGLYSIDIFKKRKWGNSSPFSDWARGIKNFIHCQKEGYWPSYNNNQVVKVEL